MDLSKTTAHYLGNRPIKAIYQGSRKIWPKLPYTPLDHIQFNGSQYLDTGIDVTGRPTIICDYTMTGTIDPGGINYLFGTPDATAFFQMCTQTITRWALKWGGQTNGAGTTAIAMPTRNTLTIMAGTSGVNTTATQTGDTPLTLTCAGSLLTAKSAIFIGCYTNTYAGQRFVGQIHSFQISKNGALVADMIPAILNTTSQIGLWCNTRQQFYPPTVGTLTGA